MYKVIRKPIKEGVLEYNYVGLKELEKLVKWYVHDINKQVKGKYDSIVDVEVDKKNISVEPSKVYGKKLSKNELDLEIETENLQVDIVIKDAEFITTSGDKIKATIKYSHFDKHDELYYIGNSNINKVVNDVVEALKSLH